MKKLTLIADVLLISLSAGLFLPNSTINMAKYQSDNNKSLITEKDNITPEEVMDNQIPDELYDVGNEDQWYISQAVRRAVDKEEADNNAELFRKDDTSIVNCREIKDKEDNIIYVGKAVNLKNRVSSYFRKTNKTDRIIKMVSQMNIIFQHNMELR